MSVSQIEQGVSPEDLKRHHRKYGPFIKRVLGISSLSPDWLTVNRIVSDEKSAQPLVDASEEALSKLHPHVSTMLRLKYGLESTKSEPLSDLELGHVLGISSSTASRRLQNAFRSLDYGNRMDRIKRIVYPERHPLGS